MTFGAAGAGAALVGATATGAPAESVRVAPVAALAAPAFELPFPCGQSWTGNSTNSTAHRSWEIDFNRGSTAGADLGDTVTASAAGTVATSAHQGSANGYGNLVVIDHGGGWKSYYAHLQSRAVSFGQRVARGQKLGAVGDTSKPGNDISPHLHYEQRLGTGYPGNIQKAAFHGRTFGYPQQTLKSQNCDGGTRATTPGTRAMSAPPPQASASDGAA
ncbi:M23 family metallopeptidase [Spirillospora sp. CA-294931]|uniref:M23 family metallopeptidase n=1 Tax=Spirillospora sp. CA-294931 TaxID=3240042 RepID=UPI003D8C8FB7